MSADLAIECGSDKLKSMQLTLGVPILLLYLIPFPVGALWHLHRNHSPGSHFYFLANGFRKGRHWWFIVPLLKTGLIQLISAFLSTQPGMQIVCIVCVLATNGWLNSLSMPLDGVGLNAAEFSSLTVR